VNAPGTHYAGFLETAELLEKEIRQFIRERLRENTSRSDVLSMLVRARDEHDSGLHDDEIVSLTTSMLFGGLDPITNTLSWTLVLLSQHPEVLANVQSELDRVLSGADPTEDDLLRLPLLNAIVNESLRLLPAIAHLIFRRPTTPIRLGPHALPKEGLVVLSPFVTHRHPDLFPNPARFQPERWNQIKPGPYEYMPFGAGPRMCIGAGFAAQVLRVQLATILRRFHPQLPPNVRIDYQVRAANLGTKTPIPLRLLRRREAVHKPNAIRGTIHTLVDFPSKA
jgi:cytochrome P450